MKNDLDSIARFILKNSGKKRSVGDVAEIMKEHYIKSHNTDRPPSQAECVSGVFSKKAIAASKEEAVWKNALERNINASCKNIASSVCSQASHVCNWSISHLARRDTTDSRAIGPGESN